jgi:quercetin dioxygenase-like cupin family protein
MSNTVANKVDGEVAASSINALQEEMMKMPQAPGMDTEHYFAGGMYCRKIAIPKGTVVVSKVHKTEHLFIGCVGELEVAGQGETYVIRPGDVVPSPVGTKRAVLALTDVVVMTVHKTDVTKVSDLEEELMDDEGLSLYDVNNQPKQGVTTVTPAIEGK